MAGLAVVFGRQLLNGPQDYFCFTILIFIYYLKYNTIEIHSRIFLPLNISALGSVYCKLTDRQMKGTEW